VYLVLTVIIVAATGFRAWYFSGWLHFEMDQARDAMVVRDAVQQGFSQLPLLGPRAAGTFLRLGPAFYYFQYLSAKITGSIDPSVFAYPDLIFNILAVPLFFFFLRLYFKKTSSLFGTALFAFSFVAVQYSRFAWNPNSVPFWTLLFLFSLVKFGRVEKEKGKYIWAAIGALSLGIASQLHFLALISLPIIAIAFLVWSKAYRNLNFKRIALVLAILIALYIPVILSEVKTGGSNSMEFLSAIASKPSDNTLGQKIFKTIEVNSQYYLFLLTSNISLISRTSLVIGAVFIAASLIFVFFKFRDEKDEKRKNFLKMIFLWFVVSYILIFPFAFQVRPRFFFTAFFLPFIFFVFWIEWLEVFFEKRKKLLYGVLFSALVTFLVGFLNMEGVSAGFRGAARDQEPEFWRNRPFVAQEIEKIPLYQISQAVDYLAKRAQKENKKIHLDGNMTYRVPMQYLLELKNPAVNFEIMSRFDDKPGDLYFTIVSDTVGCYGRTKVLLGSELAATHYFGHRFALCELKLPVGFETTRPKKPPKVKKEKTPEEESASDAKDDINRNAKDRVYWGDLFK
ncbi:MAG: glycosyltransferase family 39 protein, partial [Candidatus Moranbacteria bacterium]|nr:glycosyltransferase family 39 protein [Candidatus Moranbacteria bacterium]